MPCAYLEIPLNFIRFTTSDTSILLSTLVLIVSFYFEVSFEFGNQYLFFYCVKTKAGVMTDCILLCAFHTDFCLLPLSIAVS